MIYGCNIFVIARTPNFKESVKS